VLRLLFSKMNAGEAATNWRDGLQSRGSQETRQNDNDLNQSFEAGVEGGGDVEEGEESEEELGSDVFNELVNN
jgi:hypothetical protein